MIEDGASKEDFQIELLGEYSLEECLEREKELAMTSLFPKGLNGNAGTFILQTEEVNEKKRRAILGRKHTVETKRKLSEKGKAVSRTEEFKKKVSEFHTGRKRSKDTCLKIGEAHKGKVISEEARLKMSLAKKGVKRTPHLEETKEKIRQANLRRGNMSQETRNRIRMAMIR